jgi:NitT/TauT family transport system ATP-binding protein
MVASTTRPSAEVPSIRFEQVSKVFATSDGLVHALDKVDFTIEAQEFCSLVGPSGCGKSTLMLMIAGLEHPSNGRVAVAGETITKPYTDLGVVFQRDVLLEWRTAVRNVLLQAEIRKLDGARSRARALELLRMVGLAGFEDKYPSQLSGGMRQRASICRALVHDPPLLLMDEPFGALDALTREQMDRDLLRMWESEPKTVLFITHSITEAIFLSDRVIVMSPRPGRVEDSLRIDLPRPRRPSIRQSPEFQGYVRRIEEVFRSVGLLSEG